MFQKICSCEFFGDSDWVSWFSCPIQRCDGVENVAVGGNIELITIEGFNRGANRITNNTITKLRAWTTDSDSAVVQLGCRTETAQGWTAVPTSWMFKLERAEGDQWLVTRIAFRSLAGREPTRLLR